MALRLVLVFSLACAVLPAAAAAQQFPAALSDGEAQEIRTVVDSMRRDPRGPYLRIRWFCADGSVHPPQGTPCRELGGGVQHAERNAAALRLADLSVHVGTILQAETTEALIDSAHAGYRLRELVIGHYLEAIDDGWVLRRARYYRGARQIEDEEARGTELLQRLLEDPTWTARHFLLASDLVQVVPHVGMAGDQRTFQIRNLATEIAALDTTFTNLRIKLHSFPSRDDRQAVARFRRARARDPAVDVKLGTLDSLLRVQYDERSALDALAQYRRRLGGSIGERIAAVERVLAGGTPNQRFTALADFSAFLRGEIERSANGRRSLLLMGLSQAVRDQAFVVAQTLVDTAGPVVRAQELRRLVDYVALGYGSGLFSGRERRALMQELTRLLTADQLTMLEYRQSLRYLARSLEWGPATIRSVYRPVTDRYVRFEPRAEGYVDAAARGTVLLPLSTAMDRLLVDADRLLGTAHQIGTTTVGAGIRGLNAGVALRVLDLHFDHSTAGLDATRIYVLPDATPELRPVAGVLTLGQGNLLSHVQLLARNLGIPNAAVAPDLLPALKALAGDTVFYAVSPLGRVVLKAAADATADERALVQQSRAVRTERHRLNTGRLRLGAWRPIPLRELGLAQSGVVVGPKAANLGQLATFFPDRVSKGVALPFGMFRRHVNRPFESDRTVLEELQAAYLVAAEMRAAGQTEDEIDRHMFTALAKVRRAILELEWQPEVRAAILDAVRATFGNAIADGVFVRSDTNVEDLPQFSGAGLNLTVPHQVSEEQILASVRRVWTSPFSERAYLWRKQILDEQSEIYPSVLLLESVHSEVSGVLISSGLQYGRPDDLTIAVAEGVGGAVEGEEAETIVVSPGGAVRLLSQAKAPVRRRLLPAPAGGAQMIAAALPDTLLHPAEIQQLQRIVDDWRARVPDDGVPQVWDIEFGVVRGKVWLFQIRPFVQFRSSALHARLSVFDRELVRRGARPLHLETAP